MRVFITGRPTFVAFLGLKLAASFFRRTVRKLLGSVKSRGVEATPDTIPRIIWIYWDRGEAEAPEIVTRCIASWKMSNPGWTINLIDDSSVESFVDLSELNGLPVQAFSDVLRLRLLNRYGGVWADATAYCVKPLDNWLPVVARQGFFAFSWIRTDRWFLWPGVYRSIGSWFMASVPNGYIVSDWEKYSLDYWQHRQEAHIYFWLHIIFDYLRVISRRFRIQHARMPKIGCFGAHIIYDCVLCGNKPDANIVRALSLGVAPVQKLRWDWTGNDLELANCIIDSLDRNSGDETDIG